MIRYFHSDRCINNTHIKEFNQWKITANELVSFDCGLMEMKNQFRFYGYDLVDISCYISAITNCGAEFEHEISRTFLYIL